MNKYKNLLVLVFLFSINICSAQGIIRESLWLEGNRSSSTMECRIIDDEILFTSFNFDFEQNHIYFSRIDSSFDSITTVPLYAIDSLMVGGDADIIKTMDNGYLITTQSASEATFKLIKFNKDLEFLWSKDFIFPENGIRVDNIIETDSMLYLVGHGNTFENLDRNVHGLIVDKEGNLIEEKILLSRSPHLTLTVDDAILKSDRLLICVRMTNTNGTYADITNYYQEYDLDLNLLNSVSSQGHGFAEELTIQEDNNILAISNFDAFDAPIEQPHHMIKKIDQEYNHIQSYSFFYPPFYSHPDWLGLYNVAEHIFSDSRGGYYLIGRIFGDSSYFDFATSSGNSSSGFSLIKLDEELNEEWHYIDGFNNSSPVAAGTLSSGNIVVIGDGFDINSDGDLSNAITLFKLGPDACEEPGCRISSTFSLPSSDELDLTISPNPSKNSISINHTDKNKIENAEFYNINGIKIMSIKSNFDAIDISRLIAGSYIIKISYDDKWATRRFVKI